MKGTDYSKRTVGGRLKSAVRQQTLLETEYYINHTYLEKKRFRPILPCFMKYRTQRSSRQVSEGGAKRNM